jgi:predicted small integral membrane protein
METLATDLATEMEWMAWTGPTAAFFAGIALILAAMTAWQTVSPTIERRGFLPMPTTRGDRLFIGLLGSAYIHLAFIGFTDLNLWIAFGVSLVWMAVVMKFG